MPPRPLGPTTVSLYQGALSRAFGNAEPPFEVPPAVLSWTEPSKALLRAAVKRRYTEAGLDSTAILEDIPIQWAVKREVEIPSEVEATNYEHACAALAPGRRAMALLPLAMGLRAREAITLPRRAVERAAAHGELLVLRKGGKEQLLPAQHAKKLFEEMLSVRAVKRTRLFESCLAEGKAWKLAGDILSTGERGGAYAALHRLVRSTGEAAGLEEMHPHLLRHAFATRMMRDGAKIPVISWMLGHSDIKTTLKYLHPGAIDAAEFVREF